MTDIIGEELRKMVSLQFDEKRLLDAGDVEGCLSAVTARLGRIVQFYRWFFMAILICPVVLMFLSVSFGWHNSERQGSSYQFAVFSWQFAFLSWMTHLNVPSLFDARLKVARLETLATIQRIASLK